MARPAFETALRGALAELGYRERDTGDRGRGRGRAVWVTAVDGLDAARDRVTTAADAEGARAIVVPRAAGEELRTFGTCERLLALVLPDIGDEVVARYADALAYVAPDLVGAPERPSPLDAHAVAFAIVRRISRESLQTANHIDAVARLLLAAHRAGDEPWAVVLERFDQIDRPSMRVLHRLQWLAEPDDDITIVGLCAGDPLAAPPDEGGVRGRVALARSRLYRKLAGDLPPLVLAAAPAQLAVPPPVPARADGFDYTLRVAENLVEQNYDQAYLLAERGLAGGAPASAAPDLHRLVGLVDANIGEYAAAEESLRTAIDLAERPPLRAHLHYLLALLLTKRRYDLDEAERAYRRGLEILDAAERDGEADFERAWLCNGLAFVAALRSRAMTPAERGAALEQVLRDEIDAYRLVQRGSAPHLVYLRHNLLANMAFVLEMLQRYPEAIEFWERAFGQYVGQGPAARRFEPIYRYRVGLLQHKSGRGEDALDNLATARTIAGELGDRFLEERICYGLGYVALEAGRLDVASTAFSDGLSLAWQLRDWPACAEQGTGAWTAARRGGDAAAAEAVRNWLALGPHEHLAETARDLDGARLNPPSPKLPAYLPGIDLEPTPDVNLNVYLATGGTAFPAPPSPVGAAAGGSAAAPAQAAP